MLSRLKLKNQKSVTFRCQNFCVPISRTKTLKHTIHAKKSNGFSASPLTLSNGLSYAPFDLITTMPSLQGIKRIHNAEFMVNKTQINSIIVVTSTQVKSVSLQTPFTTDMQFRDYICFANGKANGKDYCFAGATDGLYAFNENLSVQKVNLTCSPVELFSGCNRLFVLDSDWQTIHFSSEFEMMEFTDTQLAGSFRATPSLGKVLSFDTYMGKLLIVQENGFSVLEPDYDPSRFKIKTLATCYEHIIPGSIRSLGDSIFFLTKAGMCRLQKGTIQLLDIDFGKDAEETKSIIYDGKYYLAHNGEVLIIERFYESWSIFKLFSIEGFHNIWSRNGRRFVVLADSKLYQIQPDECGGTWQSDWFSLSYASGKQYVKQILIKTIEPITVEIQNTINTQRIAVFGNPDVQKFNLNFKGEVFKISITAQNGKANITDLAVNVGFGM